MDDKSWEQIKHFNKNEAWGDWTKMYKELFFKLDAFRELIGCPVTINCGWSKSGHSYKNSKHYLGMAVDLHVKGIPVMDQFLAASRLGLSIGVYGDWKSPGIHVDIRPGKKALWLAFNLKVEKGFKQCYTSLDSVNIGYYIYGIGRE